MATSVGRREMRDGGRRHQGGADDVGVEDRLQVSASVSTRLARGPIAGV